MSGGPGWKPLRGQEDHDPSSQCLNPEPDLRERIPQPVPTEMVQPEPDAPGPSMAGSSTARKATKCTCSSAAGTR